MICLITIQYILHNINFDSIFTKRFCDTDPHRYHICSLPSDRYTCKVTTYYPIFAVWCMSRMSLFANSAYRHCDIEFIHWLAITVYVWYRKRYKGRMQLLNIYSVNLAFGLSTVLVYHSIIISLIFEYMQCQFYTNDVT